MKFLPAVIILAIAFGVGYGVLFSTTYPQVKIYIGLVMLFGLSGLLTAMAVVGIYQAIFGRRDTTPTKPSPK